MSEQTNPLVAFSNALAEAVSFSGPTTVLVNARKRIPASGVLFDAGLVITANHVVERDSDLTVIDANGSEFKATLAGRDPASDLAVLRLNEQTHSLAQPAEEPGRIGQFVLALGRPTLGGIEASLGVISALGGPVRTARGGLLESFIRTDTTPYPGFSGGPLINASGQVLGINTSGFTPGGAITIPARLAWQTGHNLAAHGRLRRGYLGIRSQPVELPPNAEQALQRAQSSGLLLVGVDNDSPAGNAGLIVGDIIVGIDGHPVSDPDELLSRLTEELIGRQTSIELFRGGQRKELSIVIGERE